MKNVVAIVRMLLPVLFGFAVSSAIFGNTKLGLTIALVGLVCSYLVNLGSKQQAVELRPLKTLDPYIANVRQTTLDSFGSITSILSEPEMKAAVSNLGACNIEVIWRIKARRIAHGSTRHYDGKKRVQISAHQDFCDGWSSKNLSAKSGAEALVMADSEVAKVKTVEAGWRNDWRQTVWMAEHAGNRWFHIKREVGYFDDSGGHFLALFHFYITTNGDGS